MNYILTPEFHRNLWLKFSPFRLVAAPVFIGVLVAICLKIVPEKNFIFDRDYSYTLLTQGGLWFYFLVVVLWGNYEAGTAMQEEIRGNTWDFQRMSSITAIQLVAGKLFGATSYVWYIGILTLIPLYYGLSHLDLPAPSYRNFTPGGGGVVWEPDNDLYVIFYLVLAGLVGHSLAFLVSFVDLTSFIARTGKKRIPRGSGAFALGVVASYFVFTMAQQVSPKLAESYSMFRDNRVTEWFGAKYDTEVFTAISLLFFLAWFVAGSFRLARAELMHRTMPVVWMGFVASLLFALYGFANAAHAYYYGNLLGIFVLALLLCYGVMLFEASDGRKYSRFFSYLQKGEWRRAFENTHKWVVTVPFVLVPLWATVANVPTDGGYLNPSIMLSFMAAILLFALRDGIIIHIAVRGQGARNIGFKVMFYYLMAYVLLPTLHFALLPKSIQDFNLKAWIRALAGQAGAGTVDDLVPDIIKTLVVYYPLPLKNALYTIGPVFLEAALAGLWLFYSIRRARQKREQLSQVIANPKG